MKFTKPFSFVALVITMSIALLIPAPTANAQAYKAPSLVTGGTNNIAAMATNVYGNTFTVAKQNDCGFSFKGKTTIDTNVTLTAVFAKSIDSTDYETAPSVLLSIPFAGTTNVFLTNIAVNGVCSLKFVELRNTTYGVVTGLVVKQSLKYPAASGLRD